MAVLCVLYALLALCPLALTRHDDDFAFDNGEELQVELTANHSEIEKNGLRRLWGVPDTSAYVGHLFRMEIPKEAFSGEVLAYKVRGEGGRHTPNWLAVDSRHGIISGVPLAHDRGSHTFSVTAHGRSVGLTAVDTFTVEVKRSEEKPQSKYGSCAGGLNRLLLTILVDTSFAHITPRQRIRALMELANFMALDGDEFWIEPYKAQSNHENTVLMSGVGTTQTKRSDGTTAIYLNVGCGDKLWSRHKVLVMGLREQVRDGTLAQVLRLPVLGWRLSSVKPAPRLKRQLTDDVGSGGYYEGDDDDDADYSGYEDEDEYDRTEFESPVTSPRVDLPPPSASPPIPPPGPEVRHQHPHPHRHHHGELPPEYPDAPRATTAADTTFQTETEVDEPFTAPPPDTALPAAHATAPSPATRDYAVVVTDLPSPSPSPAPTPRPPPHTTVEGPSTGAPASADITPELATTTTATTNTIVPKERNNIKIEAYPGNSSYSSNDIHSTIDRKEHSPVIIVPESDITTSTEPELQTVIISASNEVPILKTWSTPTPTPTPSTSTAVSTTPSTVPTAAPPPAAPPSSSSSERASSTTVVTSSPTTPLTTAPTPTPTTPTTITTPPTQTTTPSTIANTIPTTTNSTTEITMTRVTKQEAIPSTERASTIIGRTTETVTFGMPVNQPPTLKHHMRKLAITAGKAFRYIIPADLFTDPEDGTNLTFTMYEADNVPLNKNSWIQFTPSNLEVYGLPLEAHVSQWNFIVEARDSEGATARGPLDIVVQQHKGRRTVNHQFLIKFKLIKNYLLAIDWQIRALEGIVNLFRDTDMHHLTVLNVTSSGDNYEFVWTNDTLPKDTCPTDDINRLMKIMQSENEPGSPSSGLVRAMQPELKAVGVSWTGVGPCAGVSAVTTVSPVAPRAPDTYPPVTRNQVDHLTATVGHLLVYRVPEDTFFDPEDGGTRNLKLSLRFSDRSELPDNHWLQFDSRNQEFYGLPYSEDEGSMQYQLVAEDSSNKIAYDSLVVEVVKAPTIRPTVEFHMTMEYPTSLAYNALTKRKMVEKLAALFEQRDTSAIRIISITENPTTIVWYNTSLPMDRCPNEEIAELRRMVIMDERGSAQRAFKPNVDKIFDKEFKVMSIRFVNLGLCADQNTKLFKSYDPSIFTDVKVPAHTNTNTNTKSVNSNAYTEYLVTFIIPAIVIVCMILVAGIIACVLYRRRRTGKMSVGDEEERQAFRSKGIPVIFQDELEERADTEPVHKSPVIMREEKPPLLPPAPDYRADDAPYRPPPPFAASRTPPRPKATPVYRKPPPYVAP